MYVILTVLASVSLVTKNLVQWHEAAVSLSLILLHTLLAFDLLLLFCLFLDIFVCVFSVHHLKYVLLVHLP